MDRARACGLDLLRKVVDQHTLDQALSETGMINADIRKILDIATHEWGVEVTLVELKDIRLPDSEAHDGSPSRGRAREASQNYCGRADSREGRWNPPPSLTKNYAGTYP
jgi:regulator of protease activity HflC (stomatin/prohibitin superfamily)